MKANMRRSIGIVLAVGLLTVPAGLGAETLTYVDLVNRLTDLERLAVLPAPGETCQQWSSYDRATRYDEATGKHVAWDANGDGGHFIREENGELVFAEMEGPGCIWRIWSARPEKGHVRIYLDGAEQPAVDLPFHGYFDGKNEPFTRGALVYTVARGWNNYTPIPYQKSCKITADKGWGAYFQFTYSTFPEDTVVPAFTRDLSPEEAAALDKADGYLSAMGKAPAVRHPEEKLVLKAVKAKPQTTVPVLSLEGPRAITRLRAKLDLPESPADRAVLRELVLKITWDGDDAPSVWTPLGDFFGTAPGANPYQSLPLGLGEDGWWYSCWYMPFAERARVELVNDGDAPRKVDFEIMHAPLTQPVDRLARFHAKWHRDAFLPPEPERWIDWTILATQGAGRFCGVMLHVWNPRGGWWDEGDEKFHVDGEKFPSTIGTGSEDYFGYAWCTPQLFTRAYHNQTLVSGNVGHVSVNRWQITDNIPFQQSFDGYIEKYYKNEKPTLYDAVAYWYLAPGGKDPYVPAPLEDRMVWPEPQIPRVKGAIEGEAMKILAKTAGDPRPQDLAGFGDGWSALKHLWWTGAKPGDRLDLRVPVEKAGTYAVTMQLTKARDYGIVQLELDGDKLGEPLDLYNPSVVPTGVLELGQHALTTGDHTLTIEITGANPEAIKSYMAGVDYVKLDAVAK